MILSVKDLEFKYPSHNVLKDVSFSLESGECLAILGTNGTGKSTLLKCINRILKPKNGSTIIEACEVEKLNPVELAQKIAYVSQSNKVNKTTVFDTILIGRKPYIKWDVTRKDLQIVNETIEILGLEKYLLRYIDELSGGEFQKVLIARALVQEPKVLMLDEPTSSLDLKNQLEVIEIIKKVVKERNISALVTMHDLNLALRFANKFMFLKNGEIFAAGGVEVMTAENIESVYSVAVNIHEYNNIPLIIPV
ncbi:ABC transporter ATP-binding protein [Clostridium rectalis]|uniref:ABC transporter ATP-binding protein n=1 Tax=Clostridium rectalis TaxID=2040295 RepID=UPI000F635152|nr:ABC transporter ATP-binding protein [Clostridium rectalis]